MLRKIKIKQFDEQHEVMGLFRVCLTFNGNYQISNFSVEFNRVSPNVRET